jgi:hypothetical protein
MKKNTYIYIVLAVAGIAAAIIVYRMMNKNSAGSTGTNYAQGELDPVPNPMSGAGGGGGGAAAGIGMEAASAAQVSEMLQMTTVTK